MQQQSYSLYQKIGLIAGPLLCLLFYNLPTELISAEADKVLAVALWMICWWITEAVSISITALIPLTLFPLLQIMPLETAAASYGHKIVFLFFGGFVMALGLEKVNLHKRIALVIIRLTGTSPDKVVLGFMLATAFLSMWISNTATTVVMLPIAISVINLLIHDEDGFTASDRNFALSMVLGIAYAANVGGVATIIGTPPNTVVVGFLSDEYNMDISFLSWMQVGLPFSIVMLAVIYFLLVKVVFPNKMTDTGSSDQVIQTEYAKLGAVSGREKMVLLIFGITIFLWIAKTGINDLVPWITLSDTGISLLAAFSMFAFPYYFRKGDFILKWEDTVRLPWGILILFGGGLCLAKGLSDAGVIQFIGDLVASKQGLGVLLVTAMLVTIVLFMTELMSNVALVAIFAPVVAGIALGLDAEVTQVLIPVAMASSCAFMLPMATPPNAIVFASGHVKVGDMVRAGVVLNVISILIILLLATWLLPLVF